MKRTAAMLSAVLATSLLAGCAASHKDDTTQSQGKILGGIADPVAQNDPELSGPEPAIQAQTHFAAGQFAEAEGNFTVAAAQYEKACAAQKDYLWAEYRLAVAYSHMNDWSKSVAAWNNYIESTNGAASAYSNLGFTWELAGDSSRAEEAYKKGIARDPKSQPCRVNYGLLLARNDRTAEAVEQFKTCLTPAEVHYNLASVYEQQGRQKMARSEYQTALKLDPQMRDARERLAAINVNE